MANITKRFKKNRKGTVKELAGWEIRTSRITGKEITYYCAATCYDLSDVVKRCEIINAIEVTTAKNKPANSDTIAEIIEVNDGKFLTWLEKFGVINISRVLSYSELTERAIDGYKKLNDKDGTLENIRYYAVYFQKFLIEKGKSPYISEVTKTIAREFAAWLKDKTISNEGRKPLKISTVNRILGRVSQVFQWGVKNLDDLQYNPFVSVDKITDCAEKPKDYLSEAQIIEVLDALEDTENPRFWTLWFLMGARQGLRIYSECPLLKWEFIDTEKGVMMILDRKRGKRGAVSWREMPIHPQTLEYLKKLREYRHRQGETTLLQEYVFSELTDITPQTLRARFLTIIQRTGLSYSIGANVLRRTASNYWGEAMGEYNENRFLGHSKEIARKHYRTGHVTAETIERYTKYLSKTR